MSWPWRLNDARPHGWFTANGLTKYGPLPNREASPLNTGMWPPRKIEEADMGVAREHFEPIIRSLEKAKP